MKKEERKKETKEKKRNKEKKRKKIPERKIETKIWSRGERKDERHWIK